MDDGARAAWKDRGRDVLTVGSPETSDTAVAAVHLNHLALLAHFYCHKSFCRGKDRLFTLSVCDHPPQSIYLSLLVRSKFYYEVFRWQVMPQLAVFSMTCPGRCRVQPEKISVFDLWCMSSQLGDVCVCTRTSLHPSTLHARANMSVNLRHKCVKFIFMDGHDA